VVDDRHPAKVRGEMIWFNSTKDLGFIATAKGDRLSVHGIDFKDGSRPEGRCGGRAVAFRVVGEGPDARAVEVDFVDEAAPRRARSRRSTGR
jgi:cold shock CspA family protein